MDEVRLNILKAQLNTLSQVNPIKAMEIQKSIQDELSKSGGEGSRGGKVIGHTKSGKPVYEKGHQVKFNDSSAGFHRTRNGTIHEIDKDKKYVLIRNEVGDLQYKPVSDITHHDDGSGMKETGNKVKNK